MFLVPIIFYSALNPPSWKDERFSELEKGESLNIMATLNFALQNKTSSDQVYAYITVLLCLACPSAIPTPAFKTQVTDR